MSIGLGSNAQVVDLSAARARRRRNGVLDRTDEVHLAKAIEQGDQQAKHTMIESNLGLVRAIARSFHSSPVPFADLVQEGTIGLVRAVERFDYRRGVKFSTYASWWIRRAMIEAVNDSRVIRIPTKASRQIAAVKRAEADLQRGRPRAVSDQSISERTGLSAATIRSLRGAAHVTASLDQPIGEDTTVLRETIADQHAIDPTVEAIQHENEQEIIAMLRLLPARHREVITRRFGLGHSREHTHAEIARRIGVGEERSRQIEREALQRLRTIAKAA
jgi:RNA polymerase primary sigma factor